MINLYDIKFGQTFTQNSKVVYNKGNIFGRPETAKIDNNNIQILENYDINKKQRPISTKQIKIHNNKQ